MVDEGAQHLGVGAVIPAGATDLVGPAGAAQAVAQIIEDGRAAVQRQAACYIDS
jgi:hypothetical protein